MQDDPTRTAEEGYFAWERGNCDDEYQERLCDERRQARVDDEAEQ